MTRSTMRIGGGGPDAPTRVLKPSEQGALLSQGEETVACAFPLEEASAANVPFGSQRITAEFTPLRDRRETDEHTMLWKDKTPALLPRLRGALRKGVACFSPGPQRTGLLTVGAVAALAVAAASWTNGAVRADEPVPVTPEPPPVVAADPLPASRPKPETVPVVAGLVDAAPPGESATPVEAARAILDGRLEDAVHLYEDLAEANPNDEAYAVVSAILERARREP